MRQILNSDFIVDTVNFMLKILIEQNEEYLKLICDDVKKSNLESTNKFINTIIEFLEASKKDLFNIDVNNYKFRYVFFKDNKVIYTAKDYSAFMSALKLDFDYIESCVVVDSVYRQQYKFGG